MAQTLKQLLEKHLFIPEEDWIFMESCLKNRGIKKGELVIQPGMVAQHIYFVIDGVFRFYVEQEEKEITFDFVFPDDIMSAYTSFLRQTPNDCFIQALSDAEVVYISQTDLQRIYTETQCGQELGRVFAEDFFMKKSNREMKLLLQSPAERYDSLFIEQPHFIQQIPQKYLASYIGITPQALSRIRSRGS